MARVCVIGLDCLTPQLAFGRYADVMPNLHALMQRGTAAHLASCVPPITVPAWACMVTGHDPGQLGLYGYKNRTPGTYAPAPVPSSLSVPQPPLWTLLSRAGKRCLVLGVPLTYPAKPLRGLMVTGSMTPEDAPYTYPPALAAYLEANFGRFIFDATEHRGSNLNALVDQVQAMTQQRFAITTAWLREEAWDFCMMVDMGPDRLHHALWHTIAEDHPNFSAHHPLRDAIRSHYATLDGHVGAVADLLGADDHLFVVSDHGAQTLRARFALNDWLQRAGYLHWRGHPAVASPLDAVDIDWDRTLAFADGGYVGRIYLNVRGRFPSGAVVQDEAHDLCERIRADLQMAARNQGVAVEIYRPQELYREARGLAPDLTVVLDDFATLAESTVGHAALLVAPGARPDGAQHARAGVMVASHRWRTPGGGFTLYDIAPTVLNILGVPASPTMIAAPLASY